MSRPRPVHHPWAEEFEDIVRGVSGGFLFGTPLLYTMEVWWLGTYISMARMLIAMVLTFVLVFMLNQTAGFRKTSVVHWPKAAMDTVEAMAIGIFCVSVILWLLQIITLATPLNEMLGKLVYESMPFTLGVALGNQFLSESAGREEKRTQGDQTHPKGTHQDRGNLHETLTDVGGTLIGAAIIALNIAPTLEIPKLAAKVAMPGLLGIMLLSLILSYAIVFIAGFANQKKRQQQQGIFQQPLSETMFAYLVSLLAAIAMLVFFQQLGLQDPWQVWLNYGIILGLPATIGGAAGRLAV